MSTTIDERVVEMRFDNRHFENNVQASLSTLEKLKRSLNLTGSAKGLENINSAAKNCNMSGLSNAVETVRLKFSALEVMAVAALANITNSAINAGKRIVSALIFDPIKSGFAEYETQINAVQTILANTSSKGTTLNQVNAALDELNTYADKTIYNFTEMTRNIGTFTAAGVELDTSVQAIKGIANLAALSGSNSQQASTAMYQLSQALASGKVNLMDWNSVVNAGMGGQVFQDSLKETARLHGVAIDQMIENEGSFRETLKNGWLTSELLTETLTKFTGDLNEQQLRTMGYAEDQIQSIIKMGQTANDAATKVKTFTQLFDTLKEAAQSGWTQSWEIIVGDFEEAKALLTEMSDTFGGIIGKSADARNAVLQGWKDLGGRTEIIEALRNTFKGIASIVTPIKEAFREIFPPITAEQLYNFTEGLRKLTENMTLSDTASQNLKSTFKGLFAIHDMGRQIFSALFNSLFGGLDDLGGGILRLTGACGEWLVKLNEMLKATDIFNKGIQGAVGLVKAAAMAVKNFAKSVSEKLNFSGLELFHSFLERVHKRLSQVGASAGSMKTGVATAVEGMGGALAGSNFLQLLKALWEGIKTVTGGIISAIGKLASGITESISNVDFSGIFDMLNTAALGGIAIGISKFLKSFSEPLEGLQGIIDGVTGILDGVRGCFEAYQTQLKAGTLLKIASAIGVLAASILVISLIDSNKLTASLGAITVLFADLMGSMAIFGKISGQITGVFKACTAMISISVAVFILASALKKIGELDPEKMTTGLVGVVGLTATITTAAKVIGNGSATIIKGAMQMIIFAAAIKILASAFEGLSKLSWEGLAKGLAGVGGLMAEISIFLNATKFSGQSITGAAGVVILAAAIKILASACEEFGQMKWEDIGKGLASIGALLAEIAIFTSMTGGAKHVISTGIALVAIGAAMKIFADAVLDFSVLDWNELAKGLAGIAGALLAVTVAVNFMPKNIVGVGIGLITLASALVIIAGALDKLGEMSWEGLAKGLIALGGALLVITVAVNAMSGTLAGAAAMLVIASAILMLAPAIIILSGMDLIGIGMSLLSLAGVFAVIGAAGLILAPLTPVILALAASIALLGIGTLAVGAGLLAFSAGLTALAVAGTAGVTALVVMVTSLISLIPLVIQKLGEGVIMFAQVIADGMPAIMSAVEEIAIGLIQVIGKITPQVVAALLLFLETLLEQLANAVPKMIDSGMRLLIGLLQGINEHIQEVVVVALKVIEEFLRGIAEGIPGVVSAGVDVIVAFIRAVGEQAPRIIEAAFKMITDFVNGLADAIRENTAPLVNAFINLADAMIDGLIDGLMSGIKGAVKAVKNVGNAVISGFKEVMGIHSPSKVFEEFGKDTVYGYSLGLEEGTPEAEKNIKMFADAAKDTAYDSLEINGGESGVFKEMGADTVAGFNSGIEEETVQTEEEIKKLADAAINAAYKSFDFGLTMKKLGVTSAEGFISGLNYMGEAIKTTMRYTFGMDDETLSYATGNLDEALSIIESRLTSYTDIASDRFSRLSQESSTSVDDMITNLKHNQMAISEWADGIAELAERGLDKGLIDELREAGPKSAGEVKALVAASDEQLRELASVMGKAGEAAVQTLVTSIPEGEPLIVEEGSNLVEALAKGMAECESLNEAMSLLIDTAWKNGLDPDIFASAGADNISAMVEGFGNTIPEVVSEAATINNAAVVELNAGAPKYTEAGENLTKAVIHGANNKQPDVISTARAITTKALGEISSFMQKFYEVGQNLVYGMINGMRSKIEDAARAAAEIAAEAYYAAMEELGIHSPSKKFFEIGKYSALGLAEGLKAYSYLPEQTVSSLGRNILDSMKEAMSMIEDIYDFDIDISPTIRLVVDMDDELNPKRNLALKGLLSKTYDVSGRMRNSEYKNPTPSSSPSEIKSISFTQNNYSPKALSRLDIYRNTKNQFSAITGVLN